MSARHAAESAAAASWFNRWMTIGSSEWMIAQPPAAWTSAAFSSIASNTSILYPHQLAQVATQISSFASSGAILYASLAWRTEEHTSELQSLIRISYAVFCLKKHPDNENSHSAKLMLIIRPQHQLHDFTKQFNMSNT